MMIRIRSRDGSERINIDNPNTTISQLRTLIELQLRVPFHHQILSQNKNLLLSKNPESIQQFTDMSDLNTQISSLGISHGSMIYLYYQGERSIPGAPIVNPAVSFGKKMMTIDDLIAKQMRIAHQENPHCLSVSFDRDCANSFQCYVNETLAFAVKRGGFMYGTVGSEGEVFVNFIYEPPQLGTEANLLLFRDPDEENRVEALALGLGMKKVGFLFTQTIDQGKKGYTLSNQEVLQASELHGQSGLKEWVTVVVKLEVNEDGAADVLFEAFQMSDQCVKLFKEGWFEEKIGDDADPKLSRMTKDVVVAGKDTREVDNDFFLVVIKILDHQGPLSSVFPVENRAEPLTMEALQNHLNRTKYLPSVKRISDFHLLLFLAKYLDLNADVPRLAMCVQFQEPVPDGYQLLFESLAAEYGY